jgi:glutathione peroxidase
MKSTSFETLTTNSCLYYMLNKSIYKFEVNSIKGEAVSLQQYAGKVLLIVNTASGCGFTPQFKDLETLYKKYQHLGFEILAFPSNDFGNQEQLEAASIAEFCSINFQTTFPIFDKIHVKGIDCHPLYKFLSNIQNRFFVLLRRRLGRTTNLSFSKCP